MPHDELKKQFFETLWSQNDLSIIPQIFDSNAVFYTSEGKCVGHQQIEAYFKGWHEAFPDYQCQIEDAFSTDANLAVSWKGTGTHLGPFRRYIPTKKKIEYPGMHLFTIKNNLITECEMVGDASKILEELNKVSDKIYSEDDFPNNFSGPSRKIYESTLHSLNPPISIAQAMVDGFRQFFSRFPITTNPPIKDLDVLMSQVKVTEIEIPAKGRTIRALLYQPITAKSAKPSLLVYCHGGGWQSLSPDWYDLPSRKLSHMSGINILSVDYRLVPEHPAPAGFDDCFDAYAWARAHADEKLQSNSKRIAVGGDSAGGPLATGVALRAMDENIPPPDAVMIISPVIDMFLENHKSYNQKSFQNLIIESGLISFQRNVYLPYNKWAEPYYNPMYADLKNFPPTFILNGEEDPMLDASKAFLQKLQEQNRDTESFIGKGMDHVYHLFLGLSDECETAYEKLADFLRRKIG